MSTPSGSSERLRAHDTLYCASSSASVPLNVAGLFVLGRGTDRASLPRDRISERPADGGTRESLEGWLALLKVAAGPPRFSPGQGRPRWATAAFPERELRAAARRRGASPNELVAALTVGAIAYVLRARGDTRPGGAVRPLIPIMVHSAARAHRLGNRGARCVTKPPVFPMEERERVRR